MTEMQMDIVQEIQKTLFESRDEKYAEFQRKLIPSVPAESIIGVRTPQLRNYAKELAGKDGIREFLDVLPHAFFEENQLHAFIISEEKDFESCIADTERFLPFIDNWATCDQLSPKVFKKNKNRLLPHIENCLHSEHAYAIRFGVGMLMQHFLDEEYRPAYADMAAGIRSKEYYVNMMTAWYFATALAKQYESVIPYLEKKSLEAWTHNKAIQKAIESYRISPEQKEYLRTLKIK